MKKFHRIPTILIAVIMTLALMTGGVLAAAYTIVGQSFNTAIEVDEPVTVMFKYGGGTGAYGGDDTWRPLADNQDAMTLQRSAGDNFVMDLDFITNLDEGQYLTLNTEFTDATGLFVFTGFPNNATIGSGNNEFLGVSVFTPGNVPPGIHPVVISFTRDTGTAP